MNTTKHDTALAKIDAELAAIAEHENTESLLRAADSNLELLKERLDRAKADASRAESLIGELERYSRECPQQIDDARFSAVRLLALDAEDDPSEREISRLISLAETVKGLRYFLASVGGKVASLRQRYTASHKLIGSLEADEQVAAAELARLKGIHDSLVKSAQAALQKSPFATA